MITFQNPPEDAFPTNPLFDALEQRTGEWAMVAEVGLDEVPEWWGDLVLNPHFEHRFVLNQDRPTRCIYLRHRISPPLADLSQA